jgi:hypothetical protein
VGRKEFTKGFDYRKGYDFGYEELPGGVEGNRPQENGASEVFARFGFP